jgi:tRNA modification GTPase
MNTTDTIAAICTGTGGAISIIRVSGENALVIANKCWRGPAELSGASARKLILGQTVDKESGDPALAVYMPGPNSYTGDDIVEIHCHGGMLNTRNVLKAVLDVGARLAEPGEFTYRAFVNGKMDLTQAEAVADLISAHTDMALHLAEQQIAGKLKDTFGDIRSRLFDMHSEIESRMDFPEEDLDWTADNTFISRLETIKAELLKLIDSQREGVILRNGIRVVIAGKPNVGKSSLLNLLLGFDRAIVTQIPGTTRDVLEELAHIRNIPVRLIDTAGIREAEDIIEGMGIERSKKSMKQAQIILWLLDASSPEPELEYAEMLTHVDHEKKNVIAVWNKTDSQHGKDLPETDLPNVYISVKNNSGITELLDLFEEKVWGFPHTEDPEIAISARHAGLLQEALQSIPEAEQNIESQDWELAAVHLKAAVSSLGSITGEDADPDILDNIFSKFCIGK